MGDRLGILGAVGLFLLFPFFPLHISNPRNISKETTVEEMFLRRDVEVSKFI